MKNYFVYTHKRKDTNEVFYVGCSCIANRPKSKVGRNSDWKSIAEKHGFEYEIVKDNLGKLQALKLEAKLIKQYGRMADGGILTNKMFKAPIIKRDYGFSKMKIGEQVFVKKLTSAQVRNMLYEVEDYRYGIFTCKTLDSGILVTRIEPMYMLDAKGELTCNFERA